MRIRFPTPLSVMRGLLAHRQPEAQVQNASPTATTVPDLFEVSAPRGAAAVNGAGPVTTRELHRQFANSVRYGLVSARQLADLEAELTADGASYALAFKLNGAVSTTLANPTLRLLNLTERLTSTVTESERRSAERELHILRRQLSTPHSTPDASPTP